MSEWSLPQTPPIRGGLSVICGCMFSGKSEELIRRVRLAIISRQKVQIFKAAPDTRYSTTAIASHNGHQVEATPVASSSELYRSVERETTIVAIDEAQFFDHEFVNVCERLAEEGRHVITAGLDLDFRGEPFGHMPLLVARADTVTKLNAICTICLSPIASRTQRLVDGVPAGYDDPLIMVGATNLYEARCRAHHVVPGRPVRNGNGRH